jgi:nucleoside-diphosphate-sugar epimerase
MKALVTGAAGFIGSQLSERLLAEGHDVVGVDAFTPYYDVEVKRRNVERLLDHHRFDLAEADLATAELHELLDGAELVFHLAGQPGVRLSWGSGFAEYVHANVVVTQRLLEACRDRSIVRFVNSSSSSVYGDAERYPTRETDRPQPVSPYGVTKLAAEHLATMYGTGFGVPTVSLRYFTVYGPRQRPDMAMHRLIRSALDGAPFPLNGDGSQARDFTYVGDIVDANMRAALTDVPPGTVLNIGGGGNVTLREVIDIVEDLVGRPVPIEYKASAPGDPARTGADTSAASALIGWSRQTSLREGLAQQVEWHRSSDQYLLLEGAVR